MKAYGAKHKNEIVRSNSRSGAMFVAITDEILKRGGVVFGCKMVSPYKAVHCVARTIEKRGCFCGSKYIQSDLMVDGKHIFTEVVEYLSKEIWVVFSGMPCQVRALSNYLKAKKIDTDKLILIDIACHGVPSPKVWRDMVAFYEKKYRSNALRVDFRNKIRYGWAAHWETIEMAKGYVHSKAFRELFLKHYILRPSCHRCRCKILPYPSDITLADFWGSNQIIPNFDDNKGVSLVFVNTRKGEAMLADIRQDMEIISCPVDQVIQPALIESAHKPENRESFWIDYKSYGIEMVINKYAGRTLKNRILEKLPNSVVRKLHREKTIEWEKK